MSILAIDGDILAYRIAAACEESFNGACDDLIDGTINSIALDTGINKMRVYLSGSNNFRYSIAVTKPYKGNREGLKKPQHLSYCYDYIVKNYRAITCHGYEADDAIASDMVQNGAIHCGIDKDIMQIAGRHYNFVEKTWTDITQEQATLNFYRQILTGDSTDNIPGLPRVGEKTAEKIIHSADTAMMDAKNYYREICAKSLPEVDVATYWKEQVLLVQLVTDLKITDLMTCSIKRKALAI